MDSPRKADALLDKIRNIFELLASRPKLGMARNEIREGLRSYPVGNYVVFYRIEPGGKGLEIARVLHGARDITRFF